MLPDNPYDYFLVAVVSDESNEVVGHIPREISLLCALFLDHAGGTIEGNDVLLEIRRIIRMRQKSSSMREQMAVIFTDNE